MHTSLLQRATNTPRVKIKSNRIYWEPSRSLRKAGFKGCALGAINNAALEQADILNNNADTHIEAGHKNAPALSTIAGILQRFQTSAEFTGKQPRTISDRNRHLKRIRADLGDIPADQLTPLRVRGWYRQMKSASPADAITHFATLRTALNWCVEEGLLNTNPTKAVRIDSPNRRHRVGTRAEFWAVINAAEELSLPSIAGIAMMAVAGMQRISDVRRLRSSQIKNGVLTLTQSKTNRTVQFQLHPLMIDRLGALPKDAPLFPSEVTGAAYTERSLNRAWSKVRILAGKQTPCVTGDDRGLNDPTLQGPLQAADLRRTGMVWSAQAGATVAQICSVSGHTIEQGTSILETYLPRHQILADQAIVKLDMIHTPSVAEIGLQLAANQ